MVNMVNAFLKNSEWNYLFLGYGTWFGDFILVSMHLRKPNVAVQSLYLPLAFPWKHRINVYWSVFGQRDKSNLSIFKRKYLIELMVLNIYSNM